MKKISAILLSAAIIFTACHNEGSSTVGEYESSSSTTEANEHKEGHEVKEGHEAKEEHNSEHMADTAASHGIADTATHKMSSESHGEEKKKETTQH